MVAVSKATAVITVSESADCRSNHNLHNGFAWAEYMTLKRGTAICPQRRGDRVDSFPTPWATRTTSLLIASLSVARRFKNFICPDS
jgi:hypothetical protein